MKKDEGEWKRIKKGEKGLKRVKYEGEWRGIELNWWE
jgi:hypothetical protein